ncbi:MAG: ribosome assembly cofactor RimP [Saprospiraceae bacterium]|nr:ribosome assembly cofactor RimP [Saprospiraceae bacterium]MCF8249531.1 ribosome assembly cofactor RimP [Saprospiraceae bacterium]MCF8281281.1 ribosome assembly cofactor RimP [Bacteroidales bacterium]MCF8310749.1 ribosome assembly cofactor RimP [Saprospiraceae bacterium]MCF8439420.1 ribosome assembly cofactor RimP [Saprospiraceae bacterium]
MAVDAFFIEEKLHELLNEKFAEEGYQDCFLVDFHLSAANKLEVFVDADSGLTLEKCQRISRHVEHHFDEAGWLGESYTLEVSSPGLTNPLKLQRQYVKNIGRKVEVTLKEGTVKTGPLVAAGETSCTIQETLVVLEGKKKKKMEVQTELPYDEIKRTMIVISF